MYVCQHILSEMGHASTKLHYEPISFSVKRRFPLGVLSFPWLPVSAVPLLSKKGLRYLLYPFISLWMVGGRISPSFTSALSNELSNNLRTKTDRGGERGKKAEIRVIFRFSSRCAFTRWILLWRSQSLQGIDWVPQQVLPAMQGGSKRKKI